jgi:methyl-accepting chemotaxis protein
MERYGERRSRKNLYAFIGLMLGIGAPLSWSVIRLIFFADPSVPVTDQIFGDFLHSAQNIALYTFMGIGTSLVMGGLGYVIGRTNDEVQQRASELVELHSEVNAQKEVFENRYTILDNNIKSFLQISSRIQKTTDCREVLSLCAEGLHDVLGYERVSLLLADDACLQLRFVATLGSDGFDSEAAALPLDERSGVFFKSFMDRKSYLVEDLAAYPSDYHLKPPATAIVALQSTSFIVCPIVVKGDARGMIVVDTPAGGRRLNDTDADTVRLFADQAASAINRINLLTAIDTLTRELNSSFTEILHRRSDYSRNLFTLEGSVDSLTGNTTHIADAAKSVMSSVDETSAAVGEISVTIEQVTRNLDSLNESVYKSASAMEEISASLKNVEQNAAVSHRVSSQVKGQADQGMAVVERTIAALAEIRDAVEQSYEGIKRLSENSSRIETIVNVINDITKRTNLLALNASIIAAQAGEYGKSFGVVADEIRNLSLQTGQSTGEIVGIIEEIMTESRNAASNVTQTKGLVRMGVGLGQQTGEALQTIMESANQAMEMTEEIKIATEEQALSVQLVTRSIEDVSTMTSQIFTVSKEQTKATRNIAQAIESIKRMTKEMATATSRQVEGGAEIRTSVDAVGTMVVDILANLENRQEESIEVVKELAVMREVAN